MPSLGAGDSGLRRCGWTDPLAALCLGAQAVSMGTRFLASEEANADPGYKQES
jgi:isopentenyl diphosphate isomerase/L-lactate dehydrogenase-like FMN-dependent dehydrogenase